MWELCSWKGSLWREYGGSQAGGGDVNEGCWGSVPLWEKYHIYSCSLAQRNSLSRGKTVPMTVLSHAPSAWYLGVLHWTPASNLFHLLVPVLCFALISSWVKPPTPPPSTATTTTKQSLLNTCWSRHEVACCPEQATSHFLSLPHTHTDIPEHL